MLGSGIYIPTEASDETLITIDSNEYKSMNSAEIEETKGKINNEIVN